MLYFLICKIEERKKKQTKKIKIYQYYGRNLCQLIESSVLITVIDNANRI